MKILVEATIPEITTDVEINLDDIEEYLLIEHLESKGYKVLIVEDFSWYKKLEKRYSELDEYFEKQTYNDLQIQQVIELITQY